MEPEKTAGANPDAMPGDRFRVAFESAPIGIALVAPDGRYLQVNDALCKLVGYPRAQLLTMTFTDVTHPDDVLSTLERKRRQLRGDPGQTRIEKRYVRSDGETVSVAVSSTLVCDTNGAPLYSVAQIEDITERVETLRALEEAEERFRRAFNDAPIGMALVAPDGRFLRANGRLVEITGYSEDLLLTMTFQEITHADDLEADVVQMRRLLAGDLRSYQTEKRYHRRDGEVIWVMLSVSLVRAGDGAPLYFVSQMEDITARKRAEAALVHLANHDSLTGLVNRRRFREELERELQLVARNPDRQATLLLLDIDRFKLVNDTLGHTAGDEVLKELAQTLTRRLRATDIVARLGGDEFAIILADAASTRDAAHVANELAETIRSQAILTSAGSATITVSIGLVQLTHGLDASDGPLIAADQALYSAKNGGRDQISVAV